MHEMREAECLVCGKPVTVVENDMEPVCEDCVGPWALLQTAGAMARGEMRHLRPPEEGGTLGEDEGQAEAG